MAPVFESAMVYAPLHEKFAQEVIEVLKKYNITDLDDFAPIHQSPNGKLGARYEQFVPILIKAIQELSDKVDKLENEGKE